MKINSKPVFWILFFIVAGVILNQLALHFSEPREIKVTIEQAQKIGQKIWMNEGAGKIENLVAWNEGEDFPSLGIGHFIWFPQGSEQRLQETFPGLLTYIAKTRPLPTWLNNIKHAPWSSREEFIKDQNSARVSELIDFLQKTVGEQTQYIIYQLENSLPNILKVISSPFSKQHVRENFYHVAMQKNGAYVLADYMIFKGDGTSSTDRYNNLGWGLAQVLENMKGNSESLRQEFVDSADFLLTRRIEFAPVDERHLLTDWQKRLQTYLQ